MGVGRKENAVKIRRMVAMYNTIPNLAWSVLHLVPVSVFCYKLLSLDVLYTFLAVSLPALLLPRSFFNRIQLSKSTSVYKKIGVGFINKFTQNGNIINGLIRKKFPQYRVVSARQKTVNSLLQQTYAFEKFHFMMFLLFIFVTAYALLKNHLGWALLLAVNNILYNVYPVFLQQYIRVRLLPLYKKQV